MVYFRFFNRSSITICVRSTFITSTSRNLVMIHIDDRNHPVNHKKEYIMRWSKVDQYRPIILSIWIVKSDETFGTQWFFIPKDQYMRINIQVSNIEFNWL